MASQSQPEGELELLFNLRMKAHRIGEPPMGSSTELAQWLAERELARVSGRSALPSAAEAIAGRTIAGSWWGEPEGSLIFRLLTELEDAPSAPSDVALLEGKRTLVSPRLAPTVLAVTRDRGRRQRVIAQLTEPARRLLEVLAAGKVVRSDEPELGGKDLRAARVALEAGLLATSTSVHTASGRHVSLIEYAGDEPTSADSGGPAVAAVPLDELFRAALRAAVVAEEREVERWFRFVEPDESLRAAAVARLEARRIVAGGKTWLSLPQ
jgi:hypothetical protein